MPSVLAIASLSTTLLLASTGAVAAPWFSGDDVTANGEVSRRIWKPEFARAGAGGARFSIGLALGLRGMVRDGLKRSASPALTMEFSAGTSLSLLPAGGRNVMLAWSQPMR